MSIKQKLLVGISTAMLFFVMAMIDTSFINVSAADEYIIPYKEVEYGKIDNGSNFTSTDLDLIGIPDTNTKNIGIYSWSLLVPMIDNLVDAPEYKKNYFFRVMIVARNASDVARDLCFTNSVYSRNLSAYLRGCSSGLRWYSTPINYYGEFLSTNFVDVPITSVCDDEYTCSFDALDWDDFLYGHVGLYIPTSESNTMYIDYIAVALMEEIPVADVDVTDWEENVSAQEAVLSLSGDTLPQLAGENVWCEIDILREDTEVTSGVIRDSNRFIGKIHLDGSVDVVKGSSTPNIKPNSNPNEYYGYDWFVGDDPEDTTWKADGVRIDYYPGYKSDLYFRHSCYTQDENGDWILSYFSGNDKGDWVKYEMPLDKQTELLTPPDTSNPLSWLWYRMRLLVYEVFGWNSFNIAKQRSIIDQQLRTKAPFAYAFAIFDFDTNEVSEVSTPQIVLAFPGADNTEVEWNSPEYVEDFLDIIRGVFMIALYLIMIIYAVRLPSRVITK